MRVLFGNLDFDIMEPSGTVPHKYFTPAEESCLSIQVWVSERHYHNEFHTHTTTAH